MKWRGCIFCLDKNGILFYWEGLQANKSERFSDLSISLLCAAFTENCCKLR